MVANSPQGLNGDDLDARLDSWSPHGLSSSEKFFFSRISMAGRVLLCISPLRHLIREA